MLVILQMLKKLNGKVNLQHEAGSFCQFTLRIPLLVEAKPTQVLQSIDQGA
jgi:chemotaxis protein histidine kinase CheA